jgi:hypothetical protein
MFAIQRFGALLLMSVLLVACGSAEEPRKPPPVEETVFRDVVVTPQQKARDVQNVVDEQKRATDRAVDEASESDQ